MALAAGRWPLAAGRLFSFISSFRCPSPAPTSKPTRSEETMASSPSGRGGRRLLFPMVVVAAAAAVVAAAAPASTCYTRVFSFGDSLADTGNFRFFYSDDDSDPVLRLPYGETFFHRATGRFTDGRIVLDFVADALGLPFVPPYLSGRRAEDFLHGANFAVGRATALSPDFFRDRGFDVGDVVHLDMELKWFRDMLNLLCPGNLSSCSEMMNQSLFIVGGIGGNDYNLPLLARVPFENVLTFTSAVIAKISSSITELIGLGAKTLVVPGNLPIGCLPWYLLKFQRDKEEDYYESGTGCIRWLNEFALYHNKLLIEELEKLRRLHPGMNIIYADYYGAAMEVFVSPQKYGIEYPLVASCGGGRYGVSEDVRCGRGKYKLCHNPETHGSWDGLHPSETVYKAIAMSLLRGSHTQTPIATTASSCTLLRETGISIEDKSL